ncbi:MAG: YkuS family protein [Limnochordales bacterium]|nr:YkuS family protein [Limnochordales bacterium]
MVRRVVALDDKLSYLRDPLARAGFQVVGLAEGLDRADAAVTSGMSQDLTGAQDIKTSAPVISADGKSPEEVIAALKERLM